MPLIVRVRNVVTVFLSTYVCGYSVIVIVCSYSVSMYVRIYVLN